jgi:hypothetical protein
MNKAVDSFDGTVPALSGTRCPSAGVATMKPVSHRVEVNVADPRPQRWRCDRSRLVGAATCDVDDRREWSLSRGHMSLFVRSLDTVA